MIPGSPHGRGRLNRGRLAAATFLALAAHLVPAIGQAKEPPAALVSVVVDDIGNVRAEGLRALELPGPVTYAFLPHTPYAARLAALAAHLGKETMLHLPMEADETRRLGPGGLTRAMDRETLRDTVLAGLESVPRVRGVNNHMGSHLTRQPDRMHWLMILLRERGGLYFVDSRTTELSVAAHAAARTGLESTSRDVFLDNDREPSAISRQLGRLLALAHQRGSALGIAHPYPETLDVLERELATLRSRHVRLVPVSELVAHRQLRTAPPQTVPIRTAAGAVGNAVRRN